VAFAAVVLVVAFYGSAFVERRTSLAAMILLSQVGFFLVPALLWCRVSRAPLVESLQLRWPTPRGWLATLFLAVGGWSVGSLIWQQLLHRFPGARAYNDWLGELLGKHGQLGFGAALFLVALVPAVCEEVAFRGVVLGGLRRSGSAALAVVGSALIFGLFHFNPYHVVAASLLGLLLGYIALESGSIVPGMAVHLVNNGLQVSVDRFPHLAERAGSPVVLGAALACTALGLWWVRGSRAEAWRATPAPAA